MSATILWNEINNDPLGRGYSSMTDAEIADSLNAANRTRNRTSMTADEILNSMNLVEYKGLSPANRTSVNVILSMGQVDPFGRAADIFVDAFGAGSETITSLAALRTESISRAQELGLSPVTEGLVIEAKARGA